MHTLFKKDFIFLHMYTKHGNKMIPTSYYAKANSYPEQLDDIGDIIRLHVRDHYITDEIDIHGPEETDPHYVYEDEFKILRHDATGSVFIAISTNYKRVIVANEPDLNLTTHIFQYPVQMDELIGVKAYAQVESDYIPGFIISADNGQPENSVFISDNICLLEYETFIKLDYTYYRNLSHHTLDQIISMRKEIIDPDNVIEE